MLLLLLRIAFYQPALVEYMTSAPPPEGDGEAAMRGLAPAEMCFFFLKDTPPPETYPLPLHAPLPISSRSSRDKPTIERPKSSRGACRAGRTAAHRTGPSRGHKTVSTNMQFQPRTRIR